jgi:hypothetical protein
VTSGASTIKTRLPAWVEQQGGRAIWAKWVKARAASCHQRAKKWKKRTGSASPVPKKSEWTEAIIEAVKACNGVAVYSAWKRSPETQKPPRQVPRWSPKIGHRRSLQNRPMS